MSQWTPLQLEQEINIFKVTKPRVSSASVGMESYAKIQIAPGVEWQELTAMMLEFLFVSGLASKGMSSTAGTARTQALGAHEEPIADSLPWLAELEEDTGESIDIHGNF